MILDVTAARSSYAHDSILSASPSRLLTMLFDRLLLDLHRAEAAQRGEDWITAGGYLVHAQEIIAELAGSLDVSRWDGADDLLGIYLFASTRLVDANVERSVSGTREIIELMEPLRQAWHDAASLVSGGTSDGRAVDFA